MLEKVPMSDKKLVYSTDPKDQKKMQQDNQKTVHKQGVDLAKLEVIFKLEKSGRGGKTVTVLERLPKNKTYLNTDDETIQAKASKQGIQILKSDLEEAIKKST